MLDKEGLTAADVSGDERFRKILRDRETEKSQNMEEFKLAHSNRIVNRNITWIVLLLVLVCFAGASLHQGLLGRASLGAAACLRQPSPSATPSRG